MAGPIMASRRRRTEHRTNGLEPIGAADAGLGEADQQKGKPAQQHMGADAVLEAVPNRSGASAV